MAVALKNYKSLSALIGNVPINDQEHSAAAPENINTARIFNIDGSAYQANNVASNLTSLVPQKSSPVSQESGDGMADAPTREEMNANLRAAGAETDTKIARMEGKLDLVLSKIDGLNTRFEDARADAKEARATAHSDNVATRANIWVVGLGLAVLIVAVAALFPAFFGMGAQVKDLVHSEIQQQIPQQKPSNSH